MSGKVFFAVTFGFLTGVFLHSIINFNIYEISLFLILWVAIFGFGYYKSQNRNLIIISIFVLASFIGLLRFSITDNIAIPSVIKSEPALYEGIVVREPEYREKTVHVVVRIDDVNILLYVPLGQKIVYGDKVKFFGEVKLPENFETDNGRVFDYRNFLGARGISFVVNYPKVEVLSHGSGNWIKNNLFNTKNIFLESIENNIPSPESALLSGFLLGVKESLGSDLENVLRRAGLSHVVVLSGFNITIIAAFIMFMFSAIRRNIRIIVGAIAIGLFAIMTGAEATVVRASLMALVVLLAHFIRRPYEVTRALIFVGVLMVFLSPKILVFDISFQLSFLATMGIIYATPVVERIFLMIPNFAHIREIIVATLSTQLFVSPFILYAMGTFSFVSIPSNLLFLPLVPLVMLTGFITGILGMISGIIALPFGQVTYYILHFQLYVAEFFGNLEIAQTTAPPFSAWWLLPSYIVIAFVIYRFSKNDSLQHSS